MTIWLAPMAMILVPSVVGCLTALWGYRVMAEVWTEILATTARRLDKAAQGKTTPETPTPTVKAGGRHSAQPSRRRQ